MQNHIIARYHERASSKAPRLYFLPQLVNISFLEMTINPWDVSTKIDRPSTDRICAIMNEVFLLWENILDL